jgi:hypothetical protein
MCGGRMHLLCGFIDKRNPSDLWVIDVYRGFCLDANHVLEMGEVFERREAEDMVVLLLLYQAGVWVDLAFVLYYRL